MIRVARIQAAVQSGTSIRSAVIDAQKISRVHECPVFFFFNKARITVTPESTLAGVMLQWENARAAQQVFNETELGRVHAGA